MQKATSNESVSEWRLQIATIGFVGFLFAALGAASRIFIVVICFTVGDAAIYWSDIALGFATMSIVGFVLGLLLASIQIVRQSETRFTTLSWYCLMVNAIGYIGHWFVVGLK